MGPRRGELNPQKITWHEAKLLQPKGGVTVTLQVTTCFGSPLPSILGTPRLSLAFEATFKKSTVFLAGTFWYSWGLVWLYMGELNPDLKEFVPPPPGKLSYPRTAGSCPRNCQGPWRRPACQCQVTVSWRGQNF